MKIAGAIETYSEGTVRGWAFVVGNPNDHLFVDVIWGDGKSIRTLAGIFRSDLVEKHPQNPYCGFEVVLTGNVGENIDTSDIQVQIAGSDIVLPWATDNAAINSDLPLVDVRDADETSIVIGPGMCCGRVLSIQGGRIDVQLDHNINDAIPMLFVNDKPAWQSPEQIQVVQSFPNAKAHRFYVSGIPSDAQITLWAAVGHQVLLCERRQTGEVSFERAVLPQLVRAKQTSLEPNAVAVTCWDGGHNPIGRAKVLYDVMAEQRPTVLFCYLFNEFGGDIWPPLSLMDLNVVTIPWHERHLYLNCMRAMQIEFDTIWMCKPRMPTFHISSNISKPDTKLILDMDDNEEQFCRSEASRTKAYGLYSIGISSYMMESVPARTAASISLLEDYSAELVRHARKPNAKPTNSDMSTIKVGFVGTVRPHKRILEAAQAINAFGRDNDIAIEFHVYGDVQPAGLQTELEQSGAVLKGTVPMAALPDHIGGMDVVLSGFPSSVQDESITKYQISAKIGDALAAGRPILVPSTRAVRDLDGVPGVHLFDEHSFGAALNNAIRESQEQVIQLPEEFRYEYAYESFCRAEKTAETAPRAKDAFALLPSTPPRPAPKPTLLLIWKQHDAGLYGRRIDMLCRSYKRAFPDHRVMMLEILNDEFKERYVSSSSGLSEMSYIRNMNTEKQFANFHNPDGVEYRQLYIAQDHLFNSTVLEFLLSSEILPTNSVIGLFPNIMNLDRIYDILMPYRVVTDVVDNQLAWSSRSQYLKVIRQYFALTRLSDAVVFNSALNRDFFQSNGYLEGVHNVVIPNWYELPSDYEDIEKSRDTNSSFNIFYSGNMNDRFDWDLVEQVSNLDPRICIHLIGEARRAQDELAKLLQLPNIVFHGVQNERRTLQLFQNADLAIMPHIVDDVSRYMNPLKVHMYAALNVEAVAMNVPGIEASELLTICGSKDEFMSEIESRLRAGQMPAPKPEALETSSAKAYLQLISQLFEEGVNAMEDGLLVPGE